MPSGADSPAGLACHVAGSIQIINARVRKRQQMRWTPRGAHLLAQVRCALINGDLAQRLQAYEAAHAEDMSPETSQFLDLLQRAAA